MPAEASVPPGLIIWTSVLPDAPGPDLIERFGTYPREFHHSALEAGFELARGDTLPQLRSALRRARANQQPVMLFVYSLRAYDVLVVALHAWRTPVVVYYQNVDPARLPWPKRLAVNFVLRCARRVLVQETRRLAKFTAELGEHRTRFFPWIVDDAFFRPTKPVSRESALFVPGDRGRLDDLVLELARRTGRRIVRVSRYFPEPVLAAYRACPNIDLRYYARWEELLRLYQECDLVLNVTDDRETSAGMTSFLEALAMNALVLTPGGRSSAGYEFSDGTKPYLTVPEPRRVESWLETIALAEKHPRTWPAGRSPRDLFLQFSGFAAASQRWRDLFRDVTA